MTKWYELARQEWSALTGSNVKCKPHKFAWESAIGKNKLSGDSALPAAWRELARRSDDVACLKNAALRTSLSRSQQEAMRNHLKAIEAIGDKLPPYVPPTCRADVCSWAKHYKQACEQSTDKVRKNLANLADKRASKLEATARADKLKHWRAAIGATANQQGQKTPSKLAYRWLKGLAGWEKSPLGRESQNEAIPEEPEDQDDLEAPHCQGKTAVFMGSSSVQRFNGSVRTTPLCD